MSFDKKGVYIAALIASVALLAFTSITISNTEFDGEDFFAASLESSEIVAYLPFNESNVYDLSENRLNITVEGPIWNSTGGIAGGGAFDFKNLGDKITIQDYNAISPSTSNKFSISLWVKLNQLEFIENYVNILEKGEQGKKEYVLRQFSKSKDGETKISFTLFNDKGASATADFSEVIKANEWMHLAIVYNSEKLEIWKDGELKERMSLEKFFPRNSNAPLILGTKENKANFKGSIDDLIIYNKALNDIEIKTIYQIVKDKMDSAKAVNSTKTITSNAISNSGSSRSVSSGSGGSSSSSSSSNTNTIEEIPRENNSINPACFISKNIWKNLDIESESGEFELEFNETPMNTSVDSVVALSMGDASKYSDLAVIIRFNSLGFIDARDKDVYKSDIQTKYEMNKTYNFKLYVNMTSHLYDVYLDGKLIAKNYAFRAEQDDISTIDRISYFTSNGTSEICILSIKKISEKQNSNTSNSTKMNLSKPLDEEIYPELRKNLVLHFKFNNEESLGETTSRVVDLSGNGNDGIVSGAIWNPSGGKLRDGAYEFDGNDKITVADADELSPSTTGKMTIAFWVKFSSLVFAGEREGYIHYMGKGYPGEHEFVFRQYSVDSARPSRLSVYQYNLEGGLGAGSYVQETIDTNEWIFLTGVFDSTRTHIWKNAVLKDSDLLSGYNIVPKNGKAPLQIGTRDGTTWLKGSIDELMIFNKSLNSDEISYLYSVTRA